MPNTWVSDTDIRFGYTLTDLDQHARIAVSIAYATAMDYSDRYDAAWHAVVDYLLTTEEQPTPRGLTLAGARAVGLLVQAHGHTHGKRMGPDGISDMPRFHRYWELARRTAPSPEELTVDRMALAQIWPRLSVTHRQVLMAYAVHGDHAATAAAIGRSYNTAKKHVSDARRAFLALWHEGETPSRPWGADRRGQTRTATQVLRERTRKQTRQVAV